MAGRDVDDEVSNLAASHRLQVIGYHVEVPAVDKRIGWLDDVPSLADVIPEATRQAQRRRLTARTLREDEPFCPRALRGERQPHQLTVF